MTVSFVGTILIQIFVPGMQGMIEIDGAESMIIQMFVAFLIVYSLYKIASLLRSQIRK
jgi:hypothetical protein